MSVLTSRDVDHFLEFGYVHLRGAFPREAAEEWAAACYRRLRIDPNDRTTWKDTRIHMGGDQYVDVAEFSPVAYAAMGELLGADRMNEPVRWSDHFIVNLGEGADREWEPAGPTAPGWHKDGDFFRHFLDSPEQGLLVFVNWTDVVHHGGPTYVATDSVKVVAEFLAARPDGVMPNEFDFRSLVGQCHRFVEAIGEAGDVFLLHPFTLHAVSQNILRVPRIITNPPVSLREPFSFHRADGDYSVVERLTLKALGRESFDFQPTHPRERFVPERVRRQQAMQAQQ